jgi:hypothetical protein
VAGKGSPSAELRMRTLKSCVLFNDRRRELNLILLRTRDERWNRIIFETGLVMVRFFKFKPIPNINKQKLIVFLL